MTGDLFRESGKRVSFKLFFALCRQEFNPSSFGAKDCSRSGGKNGYTTLPCRGGIEPHAVRLLGVLTELFLRFRCAWQYAG